MGQRIPMGGPAPQGAPQQAPQQAPQDDVNELINGVGTGLTVLTQLISSQAPQLGQEMGSVLEHYQQVIGQLTGEQAPQAPQQQAPQAPSPEPMPGQGIPASPAIRG